MLRAIAIFGAVALFVGAFSVLYVFACEDTWCAVFDWQKVKIATSFEECVAFGFPVMESFPRQCRAGDKTFIEDISTSSDPFSEQFESSEETPEFEIEEATSGIRGAIYIGPTCPAVREGEDCEDRPYETSLRVYDENKNLITVVISDENGKFEVSLKPGTYIISSDGQNVMPSAESKIVTVGRDQFTEIEFFFDSGIR